MILKGGDSKSRPPFLIPKRAGTRPAFILKDDSGGVYPRLPKPSLKIGGARGVMSESLAAFITPFVPLKVRGKARERVFILKDGR